MMPELGCPFLGGSDVVVVLLFIVAPIVSGGLVFGACFVMCT